MIQDITIDQTLIELARTMKALKALRAVRKSGTASTGYKICENCSGVNHLSRDTCFNCADTYFTRCVVASPEHAAATRASMDLTRKLADLRQGR
jgi:hypothetical protein